jgi:hypothetical protein
LLTGDPPHAWGAGPRPADWRGIVRAARIVRPRRRKSGVPRPLESICLGALAPDPGQRYPSAEALLRALRAHLATVGGSRFGTVWIRLKSTILRMPPRNSCGLQHSLPELTGGGDSHPGG